MARDRFVYWTNAKPSRDEIRLILASYVSTAPLAVTEGKDRIFVTLPGKPSHPMQHKYPRPEGTFSEDRYFEVWFDPDNKCIDVMTRFADEFTNVVADGFVHICVREFKGRLEE